MNLRNKKDITFLIIIGVLWAAYIMVLYVSPPSATAIKMGIVGPKLRFLQLTFALPYLLTWVMAVLGWRRVSNYAGIISAHPEGKGFKLIAKGFFTLFLGLLITPFLGPLKNIFPNMVTPITIVQIFSHTWFPLIGFSFLFLGTKHLLRVAGVSIKSTIFRALIVMFPFAVLYAALILTDTCRQFSATSGCTAPTYYLSDTLIVFTVALPFIAGIWIGMGSVLNAIQYYRNVTGIFYREMLEKWVRGFSLLVTAAIILNLLLSTGTLRLGNVGLGPLLTALYVFLGIQAAGYGLIASGAEKLRKIETIVIP